MWSKLVVLVSSLGMPLGNMAHATKVEGNWNLCTVLENIAPHVMSAYDANVNPGTIYGIVRKKMQSEHVKVIRSRIYVKNPDGSTGERLHRVGQIEIPDEVNDEMVRIMLPMYNTVQESIRKGSDLPSDETALKHVRDNGQESWKPDPWGWKND